MKGTIRQLLTGSVDEPPRIMSLQSENESQGAIPQPLRQNHGNSSDLAVERGNNSSEVTGGTKDIAQDASVSLYNTLV